MIKKYGKLNKKITLISIILITIISNLIPISNAARLTGEVNIFTTSEHITNDNLILYKGEGLLVIFDVYRNDGTLYEAYNAKYPTLAYNNPSEVELIDEDDFLWQVVVNGYPYKSIKEDLHCETYEEAYVATQVAIYCAYCGHSESDYTYIEGNEASKRVYNAFKEILKNARENPIYTNKNNVVKLIDNQKEWQVDYENNYLYKTYKVKTNFDIEEYKVEISNSNKAIIVDENNNKKSKFNQNETFKVIMPINELKNSGELEIKITTEVETIPIYLGTSPKNTYVLTAPRYEENINTFSQTYQENLTSINIKVQELDTKIGIENSLINLLDSNKELISTLTTNEKGQIFIENLLPGKYYIEQIATEDDYNTYSKLIELDMDYNKVVNLTINNAPVNIQNHFEKREDIIVQEEIIEKNIDSEVTEKNISDKKDVTNENNTHNSYTENNETTEKNQNNNNTNTNVNNKTDVTNQNNTNNSYTENNKTTEKNQNNNNTNTNVNNKTDITNNNSTNNSYTENNNLNKGTSTKNQNSNSTYYQETENTKTLPRTGM